MSSFDIHNWPTRITDIPAIIGMMKGAPSTPDKVYEILINFIKTPVTNRALRRLQWTHPMNWEYREKFHNHITDLLSKKWHAKKLEFLASLRNMSQYQKFILFRSKSMKQLINLNNFYSDSLINSPYYITREDSELLNALEMVLKEKLWAPLTPLIIRTEMINYAPMNRISESWISQQFEWGYRHVRLYNHPTPTPTPSPAPQSPWESVR